MKKNQTFYTTIYTILIFAIFVIPYYFIDLPFAQFDNIFISITIFLFATLVGFFISRQAARYGQIVAKVTDFDGNISFLFRSIGVFDKKYQNISAEILGKHYREIQSHGDWDFYFSQKTTTIADMHELFVACARSGDLDPAQSAIVSRAFFGLGEMQKIRKNLIALYQEKIPYFQWVFIFFLTAILIFTVSFLPSTGIVSASLVKAAFSTAVIFVISMLWQLNHLTFFETMVGASSAQDVLDIIAGSK